MSQQPPLVTVIIPTYNFSSVLRCAIESVLEQTLTDFELIVMGDGCTDDSAEVVASFNDPRVRWHNLPENTGSQGIPNTTALAMARGRYIAYLGHDDLWLPVHLERLTSLLEAEGAMWANSLMMQVGPAEFPHRFVSGFKHGNIDDAKPLMLMHRRELPFVLRWPRMDEVPPYSFTEVEVIRQLVESGIPSVSLREITAIKFALVHHRDGYKLGLPNKQPEYLRRIKQEPDFLRNELYAIIEGYATDTNDVPHLSVELRNQSQTPGFMIDIVRRLKGLPPKQEAGHEVPLELKSSNLTRQQRINELETHLEQAYPYWEATAKEVQRLAPLESQLYEANERAAAAEALQHETSEQCLSLANQLDDTHAQVARIRDQLQARSLEKDALAHRVNEMSVQLDTASREYQNLSNALASAQTARDAAAAELHQMKHTRVWQMAVAYWRLRDRLLKRG